MSRVVTIHNVKGSDNTSIEVSNTDTTPSTVQPIDDGTKKAKKCNNGDMVVWKSDNVNNTRKPCDVGCHEESSDIRTEEVNGEAEEVKDNHKVVENTSSKEEKIIRRRNDPM